MTTTAQLKSSPVGFDSGLTHLAAELRWLDLVIARYLRRFRDTVGERDSVVGAGTTYVSDREVDWLLQRPHTIKTDAADDLDTAIQQQQEVITAGVVAAEQAGTCLPLVTLASLFNLSWLETSIVLLCLAPELRRKYDRIYAYLQDDITRKRPSIDLALELFVDREEDRWQARASLGENNILFSHAIVNIVDDPHSPSGSSALSALLRLEPRLVQFLLGNNQCDLKVQTCLQVLPAVSMDVCADPQQTARLVDAVRLIADPQTLTESMPIHLHGSDFCNKRDLALSVCQWLGCPLLRVDARTLMASKIDNNEIVALLLRESILQQTPLLIENIDAWLAEDTDARSRLAVLAFWINRYCPLIFTTAFGPWPMDRVATVTVWNIAVSRAGSEQRQQHWHRVLSDLPFNADADAVESLVGRYQLNAEQIATVAKQLHWELTLSGGELTLESLAAACCDVSHHNLSNLAMQVDAHYHWDDLVLPDEEKQQLHAICAQVRYHRRVFDDWGFAERLPYGRGLSAMFFGTPGTGKTMAAQVIANDLQLQLFKIDLSGVVSKYIGETEKNLNHIFNEAQASNAILFFDEADALFGKRTDVSDAHDRYANIEVSYLLQKMEEFDGIVVLATNYRNNIDDAFMRRIRFTVEFPFPNADNRRQIWRKTFPAAMPGVDNLDFRWLANNVKLAGGNVKNIALNAAFAAAHEEQTLTMQHVLAGCKQEFLKIGKLWDQRNMQYPVTEEANSG